MQIIHKWSMASIGAQKRREELLAEVGRNWCNSQHIRRKRIKDGKIQDDTCTVYIYIYNYIYIYVYNNYMLLHV